MTTKSSVKTKDSKNVSAKALDKEKLNHIRCAWSMFPLHELYATSDSQNLHLPYEEQMFVFALQKVSDVVPTLRKDIESKFFRVYEFHVLGYTKPVGYAFIPRNICKPWVIRYTPYALSVTNLEMTPSVVEASQKSLLFGSDYFEIMSMSCGCEVIHSLGAIMGVDLVGSEA